MQTLVSIQNYWIRNSGVRGLSIFALTKFLGGLGMTALEQQKANQKIRTVCFQGVRDQ